MIGAVPLQVPGFAVSFLATVAVPLTVGALVFCGADTTSALVADLSAQGLVVTS